MLTDQSVMFVNKNEFFGGAFNDEKCWVLAVEGFAEGSSNLPIVSHLALFAVARPPDRPIVLTTLTRRRRHRSVGGLPGRGEGCRAVP